MNATRRVRSSGLTIILLLLVLAVAIPAAADGAKLHSMVYRISDRSLVEGASATLSTNDAGATMTFKSVGLPAGAYTVWWIVFNNPEYCAGPAPEGSACGIMDLLPRGGDPDVRSSVLYGGGHVVGRNGVVNIGHHLGTGDTEGANFGPGLVNPTTAEIHLVLRTHGPMDPARLPDQIDSYEFTCGACQDIQFAAFVQD